MKWSFSSNKFNLILLCTRIVHLIQVEGACTRIVGSCSQRSCREQCNSNREKSQVVEWNCNFYNLCTCTYDRPPVGRSCILGLGLCTHDCGESCCNSKCKSKYTNTGTGVCVEDYDLHFCQCVYVRWVYILIHTIQ